MRILMLVSEAPPIKSGIARVAGKLTDGLRQRGLTVDVVSANEIPRWTYKEFRISSLALHWPELQQKLQDYDILHVHGIVPTFSDVGLIAGRLGRGMRQPELGIVYTHHSDIDIAGLEGPVRLYNWAHHRLLRLADHLVASTPGYAMHLERQVAPNRVSTIGFGVDAARFANAGPKARRFTVLFVGQLRPYKGVDVLLRAWQKVENADLHIVGEGHERAALEALARDLDLRSVHFHGAVTDKVLTRFYGAAHALILPSTTRAEAFGLVLLEGMAAGCVPVASALPGVSDVVQGVGYTFPVGDSDALAGILCQLCENPDERAALGVLASARAFASHWDYTIAAYEGVYRQVKLQRLLARVGGRGELTPDALNHWLQDVTHLAGADRASLMLVEPAGKALRIAASVGLRPEIAATTRLGMGQRLAGHVAQTGRPMLVRPRAKPVRARIYPTDPPIASSVIVPLKHGARTVGVLNLARGSERLAFTTADLRWLERLATRIASRFRGYQLPPARPMAAGLRDRRSSVRLRNDPSHRVPLEGVDSRPEPPYGLPLEETGPAQDEA